MGDTHFSGPVHSEGGFVGDITLDTSITALTDSSGGTSGGDTVAAVAAATTDTTAASLTSTQNAIATLAAKINAIQAALS
jgi:hypothetical protein